MKKPTKKTLKDQVTKLQLASAIFYAALAVAAVVLIKDGSQPIQLNYVTKDLLAANGSGLGPASRNLFSVNPGQYLAVALAIGSLGALLLITKLKDTYWRGVSARISGLRWVFLGVSSAALLGAVTFLFGIHDLATLKLVAALALAAAVFGWLAERENVLAKKTHWLAFYAAIFAIVLAWLPILSVIYGAIIYGATNLSGYICAVGAIALLGTASGVANQCCQIRGKRQYKEYLFAERNYFAVDFATKVLVAAIVIVALAK